MNIKRIIAGILESNGYIIYADNKSDLGELSSCLIIDPGYDFKKYLEVLEELSLTCSGILLTHNHYDHVGAVQSLVNHTGADVYMHENDLPGYSDEVDIVLKGGEKLKLSPGLDIDVIHTPGHTAGGLCFANFKEKKIFTGDTVFNVDLGRTDLPDGSENDLVNTVKNIINVWEDDTIIYPGHGDPATMAYVRKNNKEFYDIVERGYR